MSSILFPHRPSFIFLLAFVLLLAGLTSALPTYIPTADGYLVPRQNLAPTTVDTSHTTDTPVGALTENCVVTLTPITLSNGQQAVQEVKSCMLSYNNSTTSNNGTNANSSSNTGSSGSNAGDSIGTTTSATSITATSTSASPGTTTPPTAANGGSLSINGVSAIGASQLSSLTGTMSFTSQTPAATGTSQTPAATGTTQATSAANTPTATAASSAADNVATTLASPTPSSTTQSTFTLPGRKLSVLPIGLGVFAGISVIALIVVGLVTYERTKYRKAFRERKLAESGADMGTGGMAQRT